ncbi:MAG: hypothetical protein RL268_292 [Pseudomonadota bacterium]|jgi:hypothetical protein
MTAPRKASVDGLHGLPTIKGESVRVMVDGDMLRGVVSYDCDEGWADVLEWDDGGHPLHNGEYFVTQRLYGKIEVREA